MFMAKTWPIPPIGLALPSFLTMPPLSSLVCWLGSARTANTASAGASMTLVTLDFHVVGVSAEGKKQT